MRTKLRSKFTLLLVVCAALLAVPAVAMALVADPSGTTAPAPTIQSDQEDYPPGGTVILTGSNWQPGESVNINVNDDDGQTWNRNVDVVADENGNVRDEFVLPDWFVATYYVTATGADSGAVAKTTFTDAKTNFRADLLPNQEWALRYEWYKSPNCTGILEKSEVKKLQANSVGADANPSLGESVKMWASDKTVHTSTPPLMRHSIGGLRTTAPQPSRTRPRTT